MTASEEDMVLCIDGNLYTLTLAAAEEEEEPELSEGPYSEISQESEYVQVFRESEGDEDLAGEELEDDSGSSQCLLYVDADGGAGQPWRSDEASAATPTATAEEREEVLYVCGRCGRELPSLQACRQHMLLRHQLLARNADRETLDSVSPDIASDCDAEYWLQPRTPREVRSKLCSDRNVRCTVRKCTFRFSSESSMEQHRACHSAAAPVNSKQLAHPYTCPHCASGYLAWPACSLHLARAHGLALDLMACPLCRTHTTHSAGMMVRHLATHGKTECRRCAPERPQGQRWYTRKKCQICSKMYANSKSLKKHIQAVHHKLKPFKCNVCGHSSATKNMLLLHMRQHTGEKPYTCEFCSYRTGDLNTRNKHRMRHTGEFPYRCPHCPYRSIQSGSLASHLRHRHPHLPAPPCSRHPGNKYCIMSKFYHLFK